FFLDVTSYDPKAPRGLYTARIDELRPATDQDRHRFAGQRAYEEARMFYSQGNYVQAETSHRRALEQLELAVGPQGFELVKVLLFLGYTYELQEQYSVAEAFYTRALNIQALGSQDTEAARNVVQVARFYINKKEFAEADKLLARAVAISEQLRLPEDQI